MRKALEFLIQMTDAFFASQMQRAAVRICASQRVFGRR